MSKEEQRSLKVMRSSRMALVGTKPNPVLILNSLSMQIAPQMQGDSGAACKVLTGRDC